MPRPDRQCRRQALKIPVLARERGFPASPERYPIAGMMDQSLCEARGSPDQRRGARSASVVIEAPRPRRQVGSCYPAPAARGSRPISGSAKAGQPSSGGRGVFVRRGGIQGWHRPGLDQPTAPSGSTQEWTEIARPSSPSSGAPRSARGEAGRRVTAFSTTCRAIELDADSGGGTLLTPRPPDKVVHRPGRLSRGLY
jgi:hypothetical protein